MSTDDKWERRRAARRSTPATEIERPWCVDRSFVFWMLIGVPTAIGLIGIVIILAAFNMRAGYRGARVMLTVIGAGSFLTPVVVVTAVVSSGNAWPGLLLLIPSGVIITATVLMWRPEASEYFRAV